MKMEVEKCASQDSDEDEMEIKNYMMGKNDDFEWFLCFILNIYCKAKKVSFVEKSIQMPTLLTD